MVSIREVERIIKKRNSDVQWTRVAKETFCENMEQIMEIAIERIELTRNEVNTGKRRINTVNVNSSMWNLMIELITGEKNDE